MRCFSQGDFYASFHAKLCDIFMARSFFAVLSVLADIQLAWGNYGLGKVVS